MAAPVYATDLADIVLDPPSSTGWTLISSGGGGANSFTAPETDDYIQGNQCISRNPWSSSIRGMVYNSSQTIASGAAIFIWVKSDVAQALASKASGGVQGLVGNATTALKCYYLDGNDDAFGGWKVFVIDPTVTPSTNIGSPTSATDYFGCRWNVPASGPSKGFPFKIDAIRHGRELRVTDGDLGNGYATFDGAASYAGDITRRWGLFYLKSGTYQQQGLFVMGLAGTSVDFRDSNRQIFVQNTEFVTSNFNTFEVRNAASRVDWTNISIQALGTVSKGRVLVTDNADVNIDGCTFVDMDTFTFLSNSSVIDSTFRRCGVVTPNGAVFTGNLIANSSVAADASALVWDVNQDTDGYLDGCTFSRSASTNAHHAINLGTTSPLSVTLRDVNFSGFNATNGENDSTVYVARTTGTVTIYTIGGSGTVSYKSAGALVNVVANPVTVAVNVKNESQANVQEARVFIKCAAGGPFPANASVTLTRSGATVTASHTAHGLADNDWISIAGANEDDYNGAFQITVTGANSYTYTIAETPATPATGTITATFVLINALSDASGNASMSKVFSSAQPIIGYARKQSSAPYYKEGAITGSVSSSTGFSANVQLVSDE